MHIYFSGIGGAGIGPLALIAAKAGYKVSGSDQKNNVTVEYLRQHGITDIHIGQDYAQIAEVHAKNPIDWFVYTSALPIDQPDAPELKFCSDNNIKNSKRDEFLANLLNEKKLKMVAIAGTHGKTTTTAMVIWLFKQLDIPVSYSVGGKISFGDMGEYDEKSNYFVYEADEYDHNFLSFHPHLALITGIDWDHPDIYPTRKGYYDAFRQFLDQTERALMWQQDAERIDFESDDAVILNDEDPEITQKLHLPGLVNRKDAWTAVNALKMLTNEELERLIEIVNRFPGISRRFEQIAPGIYSDYAHTPPKIRGALQLGQEVASGKVVVVYEGLHNTRQHFIKHELKNLFEGVKKLYVVPSYLAREDPNLPTLSPSALIALMNDDVRAHARPAELNDDLAKTIKHHVEDGDIVLCLTAGGGGSLDEWLRKEFN